MQLFVIVDLLISSSILDEVVADEFGLLTACEKGAVKAVKFLLNQYQDYYQDIDRRFLGANGVLN